MKKLISTRVEVDRLAAIDGMAKAEGTTRSALIERGLDILLGRETVESDARKAYVPEPPPERPEPTRPAAAHGKLKACGSGCEVLIDSKLKRCIRHGLRLEPV